MGFVWLVLLDLFRWIEMCEDSRQTQQPGRFLMPGTKVEDISGKAKNRNPEKHTLLSKSQTT